MSLVVFWTVLAQHEWKPAAQLRVRGPDLIEALANTVENEALHTDFAKVGCGGEQRLAWEMTAASSFRSAALG